MPPPITTGTPQLCTWSEATKSWVPIPAPSAAPINTDALKLGVRERELIALRAAMTGQAPPPEAFAPGEMAAAVAKAKLRLAMYGDGNLGGNIGRLDRAVVSAAAARDALSAEAARVATARDAAEKTAATVRARAEASGRPYGGSRL